MPTLRIKANLNRFKSGYLVLAITFILFIVWRNSPDFKAIGIHFQALSLDILIYGLLFAFISYLFRSIRWFGYLRIVEKKASYRFHTLIYFSGFSFTASPGKVGELMRGTYLSHIGVPFKYTFCSFISERFLDVIVVIALGCYFLLQHFSDAFILLFVFMVMVPFITTQVFKYALHLSNSPRISGWIELLSPMWQTKIATKSTFSTLLAWSAQGFILYLFLDELGVEISIAMAISLYCLSLLIGAASLIPGGIGATELGMVWLLTLIGVENDIALISSLLTRVLTLWPAIIIGVISSLVLKIYHSKYLKD